MQPPGRLVTVESRRHAPLVEKCFETPDDVRMKAAAGAQQPTLLRVGRITVDRLQRSGSAHRVRGLAFAALDLARSPVKTCSFKVAIVQSTHSSCVQPKSSTRTR
jgi:hypothetical protein